MWWVRALLAGAVVALTLGPPARAWAADDVTAHVSWRYFAETGHNVAEPFLSFYDRNGTDSSFGQPTTEAFEEDGRLVQYFQRARLEYWPENDMSQQVQLTNLGDLFGRPAEPAIPIERVPADAAYYLETGHAVSGDFLDFLGVRGGTRVFGYPTSEPYLVDGRLTQQFQRAILELWPENAAEQRVQPQLLGDRFLAEVHPLSPDHFARVEPQTGPPERWTVWGAADEDATGYMDEKMRNVDHSFHWVDGRIIEPGETFVYSRVLDQGGYELGLCYGAGGQYEWCSAGGACSGASTFYRAWTDAGLEVVHRQSHTVLPSNPQLYGRDSTIYEGLVDLIVRNNSGTRLRVRAQVDWGAPNFHVAIEGERGPAWTVNVQGPFRDGPLAFRVNYQKVFPDGRAEDNWVYTRYWTPPPTYIPPKPGG